MRATGVQLGFTLTLVVLSHAALELRAQEMQPMRAPLEYANLERAPVRPPVIALSSSVGETDKRRAEGFYYRFAYVSTYIFKVTTDFFLSRPSLS